MNHRIEFVHRTTSGIVAVVTPEGVADTASVVEAILRNGDRFVAGPDSWTTARVEVREALGGRYLYANWDGSRRNNLHDLAETPPFRSPARMTANTVFLALTKRAQAMAARLTRTMRERL